MLTCVLERCAALEIAFSVCVQWLCGSRRYLRTDVTGVGRPSFSLATRTRKFPCWSNRSRFPPRPNFFAHLTFVMLCVLLASQLAFLMPLAKFTPQTTSTTTTTTTCDTPTTYGTPTICHTPTICTTPTSITTTTSTTTSTTTTTCNTLTICGTSTICGTPTICTTLTSITTTICITPTIKPKINICMMLDKPSAAKQCVLVETFSIDRSQAKQKVKRAACEKKLLVLGSPTDTIDPPTISLDFVELIPPNTKESELCKLEDELVTSLKESGCFSLATVSLLIKYNAKANEKLSMVDLVANLQSISNNIFSASVILVLTTIIQAIKADQGE